MHLRSYLSWRFVMHLRINSRHLVITPAIRTHLEVRLERIRKHFDHVIDASAFLLSLIHI